MSRWPGLGEWDDAGFQMDQEMIGGLVCVVRLPPFSTGSVFTAARAYHTALQKRSVNYLPPLQTASLCLILSHISCTLKMYQVHGQAFYVNSCSVSSQGSFGASVCSTPSFQRKENQRIGTLDFSITGRAIKFEYLYIC